MEFYKSRKLFILKISICILEYFSRIVTRGRHYFYEEGIARDEKASRYHEEFRITENCDGVIYYVQFPIVLSITLEI